MATSIVITIPNITPITTPLIESFVVDEPDVVDVADTDETTDRNDDVENDVDGMYVDGVDNETDVNGMDAEEIDNEMTADGMYIDANGLKVGWIRVDVNGMDATEADVDGLEMDVNNGIDVDSMYIDGISELWLFTTDKVKDVEF